MVTILKWRYSGNESYVQDHIPELVNCVEDGGFLQDVSITFTKNADGKDHFRVTKKDCRTRTFRTYSHFGLKLVCRLDMSRFFDQKLIKNLIFHNVVYKDCFKHLCRQSLWVKLGVENLQWYIPHTKACMNILTTLFLAHVAGWAQFRYANRLVFWRLNSKKYLGLIVIDFKLFLWQYFGSTTSCQWVKKLVSLS